MNIPDIKVKDIVLVGKFKNRTATVQDFGKDKNGQPTVVTDIGTFPVFKLRLKRLMKGESMELWKMTKAEYEKVHGKPKSNTTLTGRFSAHKSAVAVALNQGKPVPSAVLQSYPDLKAESMNCKELSELCDFLLLEVKAPQMLLDLLDPFEPKKLTPKDKSLDFVFDKEGAEVKGTFYDKGHDEFALNIISVGAGRVSFSTSFKAHEFKKAKSDVDRVINVHMRGI